MKKIKFLAVALVAFTMFSCSSDEIENLGNNAPGEQAALSVMAVLWIVLPITVLPMQLLQSPMVLLPQRKRMWWPIRAHWMRALLQALKRKPTCWR